MLRWRLVLIGIYVVLPLVGLVLTRKHPWLGISLVVLGLGGMSFEFLWQKLEDTREESARREWEDDIRRTADDLSLDGYGLTSLEEVSRYHDAGGRAEVLRALRQQPPGQRSLLAAARHVDPDAQWD